MPGKKLAIADASQIEYRINGWIAGQADLVEKFRNNEEIYCDFAAKVLGYPVPNHKTYQGPAPIREKYKWARDSIGKVVALGCGYGLGVKRLAEIASLDEPMAARVIQVYRAENKNVVQFWYDVEKAFSYAFKYREATAMPRGLRFDWSEEADILMTLPSGRIVRYPKVRIVSEQRGEKIELFNQLEMHWEHTWGGALTENIVQAIARDVLAEAILRIEKRGFHVALSVHDEVVIPFEQDRADEGLRVALEELSREPSWAPGLPLGAEGKIADCYKKD